MHRRALSPRLCVRVSNSAVTDSLHFFHHEVIIPQRNHQNSKFSQILGSVMATYFWLIILTTLVLIKASSTSVVFALGYLLPQFALGMIFSPLIWLVSRKFSSQNWKWSHWLNAGAALTALFAIISAILRASLN